MEKRHHQFCSSKRKVRTLSVEKIPVDTPVSARGTGSAGEKVRRTAGYAEKGRMGPGALFPASLGSSWDLGLLTGPACLVTAGELLGGDRQSRVSRAELPGYSLNLRHVNLGQ